MTNTETVTTVRAIDSQIIHLGKQSRFAGRVVAQCNGRTTNGWLFTDKSVADVTCKRCVKLLAR